MNSAESLLGSGYGWIFWLILAIVILFIISRAVFWKGDRGAFGRGTPYGQTRLEELQERYDSGGITKEQYDEQRKIIEESEREGRMGG